MALSCGGSGTPAKGGLDVDVGEAEGSGRSRPRARQRTAKVVKPDQIPLLSLEGLLPEPEAPAEGEAGDDEEAGEAVAPHPPPAAPPPDAQPPLPPRNLFAFEEDPAVIAERQKQALAAAEAARAAAELRRKWQGPPPPPPPPQPPQIPFQFVGYFGAPGDRTGVFTGAGEPGPKLAKKGDVLMAQFKIVEIGYESAEIGFKNFTETRRIPLSSGGK
jgi:hypothetical protein